MHKLRNTSQCAKSVLSNVQNLVFQDTTITWGRIYTKYKFGHDLDHAHLRDSPYMHFEAIVYSKLCAKFECYSVKGCTEIASSICLSWQLGFCNNK